MTISSDHRPGTLSGELIARLQGAVQGFNGEQLLWASGYLAGLAAGQGGAPTGATVGKVGVVYLSQSGNAQKVAQQLARQLEARGIAASLVDAMDYRKVRLKQLQQLLVVASTHGEGEPPDNAVEFYNYLFADKAPKLDQLRYAVLALGDSSYQYFCKIGRDLDERLAALGAERLLPLKECDVDYADDAAQWQQQVVAQLAATESAATAMPASTGAAPVSSYSRRRPFSAEVLTNQRITGRGSNKQVHHLELSLEDSGIAYQPGDAIGVIPRNAEPLVQAVLQAAGLDGGAQVRLGDRDLPLQDALRHELELAPLTRPVVQRVAELLQAGPLQALLQPDAGKQLDEWLWGRDLLDLLQEYPVAGIAPQPFVDLLRPLPARRYSVASSPLANPDEVHLTVARVAYAARGRQRTGTASAWLADEVQAGDQVGIYVDENPNFRLPEDDDTPIIMIGPGTGVAPFRAFIEQREALGATGRNWLFFGEQHFTTDFLYQREWQGFLKSGALTRLDVAFSRDQTDKVYVQHRLREHARALYAWLEEGATLYVCGDASRMAPDVHDALQEVVMREGGLSDAAATDYLAGLQRDRRYQRDVY